MGLFRSVTRNTRVVAGRIRPLVVAQRDSLQSCEFYEAASLRDPLPARPLRAHEVKD